MSSSGSEPRLTAATGWIGLLALVAAGLSGVLLAWHYRPETATAHASVVDLESAWLSGLGGLALVVLLAYSGRALPWDAHGATSVVLARAFLTVGDLDLLGAVLGRGEATLPRLWLLHLALTGLLAAVVPVHVPLRDGMPRTMEAAPRRAVLVAGATLSALLVIAVLVPAPLGPPAEALVAGAVGAEWYLRWLQLLALQSPTGARLALVIKDLDLRDAAGKRARSFTVADEQVVAAGPGCEPLRRPGGRPITFASRWPLVHKAAHNYLMIVRDGSAGLRLLQDAIEGIEEEGAPAHRWKRP